jgi:tight adherence protein B
LTLLVLLAFLAVTGAALAVAMVARDLKRSGRQLDRRLGLGSDDVPSAAALSAESLEGNWIDRTFYRLLEGSGSRMSGPAALALVAGLAIVGCAVPLVIWESLLAAAGGTALGVTLPLGWWAYRRRRRRKAMRKALPETLDVIADAVRSGQTLEQAADLVAQQAQGPLATEFAYCAAQLKLGHTPVAVLQRMCRRVPLPEFKIFSTAVLVHRQTGGNLALLAERLAKSARDRGEFLGHLNAVTSGHRMSAIALILGTIAALGVLASFQPEYLKAFIQHPAGPTLLVVAAALQVTGILWAWRILKVSF